MAKYDIEQLELVRSDLGDGGWSIHVRRTDVDEHQDPAGAWPVVGSGDGGRWSKRNHVWSRPNKKDWASAQSAARRLVRLAASPVRSHRKVERRATKKPGAQLDREIAAALARPPNCARASGGSHPCADAHRVGHARRTRPTASRADEHLFEVTGRVDERQETHVVAAEDEQKARTRFMLIQTSLKPRGREVRFEVRQLSRPPREAPRARRSHATAKPEILRPIERLVEVRNTRGCTLEEAARSLGFTVIPRGAWSVQPPNSLVTTSGSLVIYE